MKPITQYSFPADQYVQEETQKKQIYLHHTAGNPDPFATFDWWASNSDRIATCIVIGGRPPSNKWVDGQIVQGYSSKFWAFHLGLKQAIFDANRVPYQKLDKISIGIETCNWGQLTLAPDGSFKNYVNRTVPENEVCELDKPFKGFEYYHAYTDAQIESIYELLVFWNQRFGIPLAYNPDIWGVSKRALGGEPGVYTHNSVRSDKNDMSPQPKLINMLKSL